MFYTLAGASFQKSVASFERTPMTRTKISAAVGAGLLGLLVGTSAQAQTFQLRSPSPGVRAAAAPTTLTPNLQVTGNPAPAQAFGAAYIGQNAAPLLFSLTNTGPGAGSLSLTGLGGANPGDFGATTDCTNVAAGGSCQVTVSFRPLQAGQRTAGLQIAGRDFSFSGTGQIPPTQYIVLKSGTAYSIPIGVSSVTVWAVGAGGGGAGSIAADTTSGGGGGAGGLTWQSFTVQAGQAMSYSIGAGGVGGVGGNNGLPGGNTTITVNGITLVANGGLGGWYNRSFTLNSGGWSGGTSGAAGGSGGAASGDNGGGAGGAIGGVNGIGNNSSIVAPETLYTGHRGATAGYVGGLDSALAGAGEALGGPGAGAGSGSGTTANVNHGSAATGFGHGGGSAGYYGGDGGNGAIGGGGGGASGYTSATQRGGAGGPGAVVIKLN